MLELIKALSFIPISNIPNIKSIIKKADISMYVPLEGSKAPLRAWGSVILNVFFKKALK